jgi:ABC-type branched-subunit amino acid transport system ATPase component
MSSTSSVGAPVVRGAAGNKFEVTNLEKNFGGVRVFREVSFNVPTATITALIGPNGAGKTTMINMSCGVFPASSGTIVKDGVSLANITPQRALSRGLARTFQDVRLFPTMTVLENVMVAFPNQPGDRPWELFGRKWREVEAANRAAAMTLLERLDLTGDADKRAEDIPFGNQKLVGLARATATGADMLMLDETTTGLSISRVPAVLEFLRVLKAEGRTILLIEHNMDVVTDVADQVVVLHGTVIASGTPSQVLHDPQVIRDYLGRIYDA